MNSATGFSSNVVDLLRWYQAHLLGSGRLLTDWDKREMQRLQYEDRTFRWGIGFEHSKVGDLSFVGHGGGYPGFITFSSVNQEHELAIVVLTNAIDGPAGIFFEGVVKLLAKALKDDFDGTIDSAIDRFTGFYADRWRVELVDRVGGALVSMNADSVDPNVALEVHEHIDGLRFKAPITLAISAPGEEFWFEEVDGEQRLAYPGGFTKRFRFDT
jgi:CubicO group peptidase (beta-lactamase class C family)